MKDQLVVILQEEPGRLNRAAKSLRLPKNAIAKNLAHVKTWTFNWRAYTKGNLFVIALEFDGPRQNE